MGTGCQQLCILEVSEEWGVQCVIIAQIITIDDHIDSRFLLGRYELCALASTFTSGFRLRERGAGDINRNVHLSANQADHTEISPLNRHVWYCGLVHEPKHNVWLKTF